MTTLKNECHVVWIKKSISHNKLRCATHKAFMILKIVTINEFCCLWLMINSYYQIWIKKHKYCNQFLPLLITIFHLQNSKTYHNLLKPDRCFETPNLNMFCFLFYFSFAEWVTILTLANISLRDKKTLTSLPHMTLLALGAFCWSLYTMDIKNPKIVETTNTRKWSCHGIDKNSFGPWASEVKSR